MADVLELLLRLVPRRQSSMLVILLQVSASVAWLGRRLLSSLFYFRGAIGFLPVVARSTDSWLVCVIDAVL